RDGVDRTPNHEEVYVGDERPKSCLCSGRLERCLAVNKDDITTRDITELGQPCFQDRSHRFARYETPDPPDLSGLLSLAHDWSGDDACAYGREKRTAVHHGP